MSMNDVSEAISREETAAKFFAWRQVAHDLLMELTAGKKTLLGLMRYEDMKTAYEKGQSADDFVKLWLLNRDMSIYPEDYDERGFLKTGYLPSVNMSPETVQKAIGEWKEQFSIPVQATLHTPSPANLLRGPYMVIYRRVDGFTVYSVVDSAGFDVAQIDRRFDSSVAYAIASAIVTLLNQHKIKLNLY